MDDINTANGHYSLGTGLAKIALYGFVCNSRIRNISVYSRAVYIDHLEVETIRFNRGLLWLTMAYGTIFKNSHVGLPFIGKVT
jgi:hypothetical protein